MSDAFPGRIEVTFSMTADDYARYFAVVRREESSRAGLIPFVVTLFCSIVVALTFREIAAYLAPDAEVIGMVGYFSLIAFLLGASFLVAALFAGVKLRSESTSAERSMRMNPRPRCSTRQASG